ncbi:MAG TPA: LLM class flavin-dependent oxidoreductase [Candidatus Limnocylindrales bacterium]|nr:LLM class flavin-dependent oxidoreductase [Candidatus Limnocylindrales bacterium]
MKIGLMLPLGADESGGWNNLRDLAMTADREGLDSVWGADHLVFRDADGEWHGIHESWTVLTAIAAVTERVEIGPMVLALPFRNPALTAKMAAELDAVSGGRLILGVGCGWHRPEFEAFDYPFDHRVGRFEEALEILVPLLRGETVTFEGRWHRAAEARLLPPPIRPDLPILIAGKQPRMLSLVARHADQWNAAWYGDPADADELRTRLENLGRALAEEDRDGSSLERTAGIFVALADDDDAPKTAIRGSTEEVADALARYAELDLRHLIAHTWPRTPDAVARLAEAAAMARDRLGVPVA